MAQIFISHSNADGKEAAELLEWLRTQGFSSTFLDFDEERGIAPGEKWESTLYREISAADAVILILTKNWFRSKWCFVEFAQARALGKAIFPLVETPTKEKFIGDDIQLLDLVKDREGGLDRLRQELTRIALNARGGLPWDSRRPPYPGLLAFDENDAAIYFGRDDDIRGLIQRLEARRVQGGEKLVVVLGASGAGKSSLLRAGVVPRLKQDRRNWIALQPFRPQAQPLDELALAIATALDDAKNWRQWRTTLDGENLPSALLELARDLRAAHGQNEAHILVSIDQGEELFGGADANQAERFFAVLNAMLAAHQPFLVAMALRSDFLGRLQQETRLAAPFEQFSLKPMPLERVRDIILGPAKLAGIGVDDALVTEAMADARTDDALPLLAFTLRELYDRAGGSKHLTVEAYRALGDAQAQLSPLENAVRRKADEVLNAANPSADDLLALKEAFIPGMVRVNAEGEYARRAAEMSRMPERAMPVIERLAKAYLLTVRQERGMTLVEVTHEALLRKWPLLKNWLDEEKEFLTGKEQLEQDQRDWERAAASQKNDALLWGLKLARAQSWLTEKPRQLSDAERAFIEESIRFVEARRRRQMLRRMGTLSAVLCLLFAIAIVYQVRKRLDAQAAAEAAHLATSDADLSSAAEEMQRGEIPVSLAFLADALRQNPKNARAMALAIAELRDAELPVFALAHDDEVQDAEFSRDGTMVVTASADKTARLWDARTGKQIGSAMKHRDWVHTAEFSPDGTLVVTASYDGTAGVWDTRTGQELHALHHAAGSKVYSAHFSPDGKSIVTAGSDATARVWDAQTGEEIGQPLRSGDSVWEVVFDPTAFDRNGKMRVVSASEDGTARMWDVRTGQGSKLQGKYGALNCVAFSPDGRWIAGSSDDGHATIWDARTLQPAGKPLAHGARVISVRFSPDASHPKLVTASADGAARLWDVPSGSLHGKVMQHDGWVRSAEFSRDGKWVVTASYDRTARVWDADTGRPLGAPMRHSGAVYMAHFDPADSHSVVTASFDHTARTWRWHEAKEPPELTGAGVLEQVCWDRSASRILTISDAGAQAWDGRTGQSAGQLNLPKEQETIAACSPDGQWLATASSTAAQVWDARSGQATGMSISLPAPLLDPYTGDGLRFDPKNRWLATIAVHEVRLWDAKTGQSAPGTPIHVDGNIVGATFSPDGTLVATYDKAGVAAVWRVPDGSPAGKPMTHDGALTRADFSPDGKRLVTASADHTARVWDVQTGAQLGVLHLDSWVADAEFSPDGKSIVTACADYTAQVWDAKSYQPTSQLMRQKAEVFKVEFSPDSRWVLTLAEDGTAQLWDARTGDPVSEPFSGPRPDRYKVEGAHFSGDGNWILTFWNDMDADKAANRWQVRLLEGPITAAQAPAWLIPLAEGVAGLRVSSIGALEPAPESEDPARLRESLSALPETNAVNHFGRWLAADPATRPISPLADADGRH